jgi:hypothetical protein
MILALLFVSGGDEPGQAKTYVGPVAAPHTARIAFVIQEGEFMGYVCSRENDFAGETCATWLMGTIDKDGVFKIKNSGITLSAKVAGEVVTGTVTGVQGNALFFRADLSKEGNAGLYREQQRVTGHEIVAGWIRDEQGEVVGSVNEVGANSTKEEAFGVTQSSEGPPFFLHIPPQPAEDVRVGKLDKLDDPYRWAGGRNGGKKKLPR